MTFSDTPEDRPDSWAVAEWRPASADLDGWPVRVYPRTWDRFLDYQQMSDVRARVMTRKRREFRARAAAPRLARQRQLRHRAAWTIAALACFGPFLYAVGSWVLA